MSSFRPLQTYTLVNPQVAYPGGLDDYPANSSTDGAVFVGGSVTGEIEVAGDLDWFSLYLFAGQSVTIDMAGITLDDPFLLLFDSDGKALDYDNDTGPGRDARLTFTAPESGNYYIDAGHFSLTHPDAIGTYEITVTETLTFEDGGAGGQAGSVPSPTSDPLLKDIDWGTQIDTNSVNVFFAPSGYSADGFTAEGFNDYEKGQFQIAFDLIESFTKLSFNLVTNSALANLVMLLDTDELFGYYGYFNPPGTINEGVGVFNGSAWDRTEGGDLEQGGYGFVTIVHELLHGLGLAHPHDTGGTSTIMQGVTSDYGDLGTWDLNQGVFTTMSYNTGWYSGPDDTGPFYSGSYGFEGGPMALDIAALQENYGVNTTYNNGNDIYTLPTANATGTFFQAIWDTGGTDTIRHSGTLSAVINLQAATIAEAVGGGGYVSFAEGIAGGFTIANSVVIENAIGGDGYDTLNGNAADNRLTGAGGNDSLSGNTGNDTLIGNQGHDKVQGDEGDDVVFGGLGFDTLTGGAGNDELYGGAGADLVFGSVGHDLLFGGENASGIDRLLGGYGVDTIFGGAGDDLIRGGGNAFGADQLFGGLGNDTLYGDDGRDLLIGGLGADLHVGGNADDTIRGFDGKDTLVGGFGGDLLNGGSGNDDMRGNFGDDTLYGANGNDIVNGGYGNDRLYAGNGNDFIIGSSGNDTIHAGAGADKIIGGADDDMMNGELGGDVFIFADGHGNDTINDFEAMNAHEAIDLSRVSVLNHMGDVFAATSQTGANVKIDTGGGNSILLMGIDLSDLDANDFVF